MHTLPIALLLLILVIGAVGFTIFILREAHKRDCQRSSNPASSLPWTIDTKPLPNGVVQVLVRRGNESEIVEEIPGGLSPWELENRLIDAELWAEEKAEVYNRSIERKITREKRQKFLSR